MESTMFSHRGLLLLPLLVVCDAVSVPMLVGTGSVPAGPPPGPPQCAKVSWVLFDVLRFAVDAFDCTLRQASILHGSRTSFAIHSSVFPVVVVDHTHASANDRFRWAIARRVEK